MVLKRICIEKLFGIYDYDLNLIDMSLSHVTIIDAPNGMGKTTLLRLIQATVQGEVGYLDTIPFKSFQLYFDNAVRIKVEKEQIDLSLLCTPITDVVRELKPIVRNEDDSQRVYLPGVYDNIAFYLNNDRIPVLFQQYFAESFRRRIRMRVDRNRFVHDPDNVLLKEVFQAEEVFDLDSLQNDLHEVFGEYSILFIKANRLFKFETKVDARDRHQESFVQVVELYQKRIKDLIISAGKRFADKSEELDRTFPQRVLKTIVDPSISNNIYTKEMIDEGLKDLENERNRLGELGLITDYGVSKVSLPEKDTLSIETRIFLTHYIKDNISKLEVYRDLADRMRVFRNIINERNGFSNKTMSFNSKEGIVFTASNGRSIPIKQLSSGEKHNLIMFYELIFESDKDALILIDEPEISLHVYWQRQFIDELNDICKLKELQSIVATHSPDIVGNYVDYMVDLEDISDGK